MAFEFASCDTMLASFVFAVVPAALLVLKAFIVRQLRGPASVGRLARSICLHPPAQRTQMDPLQSCVGHNASK
jgi:hypothetical protein